MRKLTTATLALCFSFGVLASTITGTLYELGSDRKTVLYQWKRQESGAEKDKKIEVRFLSPSGLVVVSEDVQLENGQVKRYDLTHRQTNESGSLEVKGGKIHFTYHRKGKTETDEEDLTDNFVIGPTLTQYVKRKWELILKGETIPIRFAVLDRLETVGFKLFKVEEKSVEGKPVVVVKMKPSSIVIAALVDPLYFTFERDTARLVNLVGRTLPKRKMGEEWKDLDAEIEYRY